MSRARPELLHSHFIPTIGRLRKRAGKVVSEEEQLRLEAKAEAEEGELLVRDEFSVNIWAIRVKRYSEILCTVPATPP